MFLVNPQYRAAISMHLLVLLFFLQFIPRTLAALTTITVDDAATGHPQVQFQYSPSEAWITQAGRGRASPDPQQAHDGTWHDTTHDTQLDKEPTVLEISFTGTGLEVFCIIANDLGPLVGTRSRYKFTLDGQPAGDFEHNPDPQRPKFEPNTRIFAKDGLPPAAHKLRIQVDGGRGKGGASLMLFDYVTVQFDDGITAPPPTSAPPPAPSQAPGGVPNARTGVQPAAQTERSPSASLSANGSSFPTATRTTATERETGLGGTETGETPPNDGVDPTYTPSPLAATANRETNAGAIAGGVLGALAILGLAGFLLWLLWRRRRLAAHRKRMDDYHFTTPGFTSATRVADATPPFVPPPPPRNPQVERWLAQQNPSMQSDPNPQPPTSSMAAFYSPSNADPERGKAPFDMQSRSTSSGGTTTVIRELRREVEQLREVLQLRSMQGPSAITQ